MLMNWHLKYTSKAITCILIIGSVATLSVSSTIVSMLEYHNGSYGYQQALAQSKASSNNGQGNFVGKGKIESVIYTISGKWGGIGNWALVASDGALKSFNTNMVWNNRTAAHTHEFLNFETKNHHVELAPDGSATIKGKMDIGTNHVITWQHVPAQIAIEKGKIITVSLDDGKTNHHFGGQAIHGTVSSLKRCSITPGPDMQVPSGCS